VSGRVHAATVSKTATIARDILQLDLDCDEPQTFRPGQFFSIRVGVDGDGNPILRSYSIASSPGKRVSFVVKIVGGGPGSSWFAARKPGDRVELTGPMGFFVNDLAHAGDVVYGATGVGIAPLLPMLDELLARDEKGRILLFWGNRRVDELFWRDELAARKAAHPRFDYQLYISGADETWDGPRGRIGSGILDALPGLSKPTFYLVGNGAMIREVKASLVDRGVDRKKQIRNEAFFD
jgi:ferredoxin-NADP reductase